MKVFVPFSEVLIERLGLNIGELVPFQLEYQCLHLADPTDGDDSPIADESPRATVALHS